VVAKRAFFAKRLGLVNVAFNDTLGIGPAVFKIWPNPHIALKKATCSSAKEGPTSLTMNLKEMSTPSPVLCAKLDLPITPRKRYTLFAEQG